MVEINIDDDKMKGIVAEAVLQTLDAESRASLIKAAILHLLTPLAQGAYGRASPLQEAFNRAVSSVAHDMARELVEKDDALMAQITKLYAEASERLFQEEGREKMVLELQTSMRRCLTGERY